MVARLVLGQQARMLAQHRHLGLHRVGEPVGRGLVVLHEAHALRGAVAPVAEVAADAAHRRHRQVEQHAGGVGLQGLQRHRRRQLVFLRRVVDLAVGQHHLQLGQPQHAGLQRVSRDLDRAHAPGIGMQRARHLGQPPLVVRVLALQVLRPQEQALAPQHLR